MSTADNSKELRTPLIEAVYYRYHAIYRLECDTVKEAEGVLCSGTEHGTLSSVGVFVDGEPVLADVWTEPHPPTDDEAQSMREDYAKAASVDD